MSYLSGITAGLLLALLSLFFDIQIPFVFVAIPFALSVLFEPKRFLQTSFFLFALAVALMPVPYGESDYGGASPPQFWYWAMVLMATAVCAFLGLQPERKSSSFWTLLPRGCVWPTTALVLASVVSVLYGLIRGGAQVEDSLRQASGLGFFFLYMIVAAKLRLPPAAVWKVFRTIEVIILSYCVVYIARYLPVMVKTGDFTRERSPLLYFAGLFATIALAKVLFFQLRSPRLEALMGLVFCIAGILSGSRAVVFSMFLTAAFLLYLRYLRRQTIVKVIFAMSVGSLLLLFTLGPFERFDLADTGSASSQIVSRFIASPTADSSYLARVAEMTSIFRVVAQNPLLGLGMGARFVWTDPVQGEVETAFVDNGLGYLLLKMGLVGLAIFCWWSSVFCRTSWSYWKSKQISQSMLILVCLIFYLAYLPFGPSFFQFSLSFWIGASVGLLISIKSTPGAATTAISAGTAD